MIKKILCILVMMLFISSAVFAMEQTVKTEVGLGAPPKKFDWTTDTNNVSKLKGKTVTSGGNTGKVTGIEDTNGDKNLTQCDDIVIKWESKDLRQPYWKYHVKKVDGPTGGKYKYSLDYNSKSKNPPKILGCYHYVNDNNTAGPWIGTLENPFNSIKQALSSGLIKDFDNIYVAGGTYYETEIVIGTRGFGLNNIGLLVCADLKTGQLNSPIINGMDLSTIITINDTAEAVISGFVLRQCGSYEEDAAIKIKSDNNRIFGNTIEDCTNGIYLLD